MSMNTEEKAVSVNSEEEKENALKKEAEDFDGNGYAGGNKALTEEMISGEGEEKDKDENEGKAAAEAKEQADAKTEAAAKTEAENIGKPFGSCTVDELYGICEKFSGEDVLSDIGSEAFRIFSSGKTGSPEKVYSEFLGLKKAFSASAKEQPAPVVPSPVSVAPREADTREHSGFGYGNPYRDTTVGLTKRQMQMARESGMSFREYEELLNSVPGAKRLR